MDQGERTVRALLKKFVILTKERSLFFFGKRQQQACRPTTEVYGPLTPSGNTGMALKASCVYHLAISFILLKKDIRITS
jgi:hypothetical protein